MYICNRRHAVYILRFFNVRNQVYVPTSRVTSHCMISSLHSPTGIYRSNAREWPDHYFCVDAWCNGVGVRQRGGRGRGMDGWMGWVCRWGILFVCFYVCVCVCVCAWWYCMYRCMDVGILACRYVSMDRYVF